MKTRLPKHVLSARDIERIRGSITGESLLKLRDRAIVEVLYSTGLRLSELAGLDIRDLNLNEKPFFYAAAHGRTFVLLWGMCDSKTLVPAVLSGGIIVANNPVSLTDPLGLSYLGMTYCEGSELKYKITSNCSPEFKDCVEKHKQDHVDFIKVGYPIHVAHQIVGSSFLL